VPIYPFPTPVMLADGSLISDPGGVRPSASQCLPYQCGADAGNTAAKMWCGYWGYSGVYSGCTDPRCSAIAPLLQCAAPVAATPTAVTPTSTALTPAAPAAVPLPPSTPAAKTVIVQTPEGAVPVSAELLPADAISDGEPAMVHIASRAEFMDFDKASPFDYLGKQTSLPGWISAQWRSVLGREAPVMTPAAVAAGADSAPDLGGAGTLLAWAAVLGAAWLLRDKKGGRRA